MARIDYLKRLIERDERGNYKYLFETVAPGVHHCLDHSALEEEHSSLTGIPVEKADKRSMASIKRLELSRHRTELEHLETWLAGADGQVVTHHNVGHFRTVLNHDRLKEHHAEHVKRIAELEKAL